MNANNRMVVNTCIMYARVAITMGVTLLSSRWVLLALGSEDFGIYSLVAGMLSLLSFLNVTMASSTQRFLSYALGKGDAYELNSVFNLSCFLHLCIGVAVLLIFEIVGSLFLNTILQIPTGKENDALFVLHCLSISMFIAVITVPFNASLITHENMLFVAFVQIGEAILKLLIAIVLLYYSGDKIRLYAICMMLIPIFSSSMFISYCFKNYRETKLSIYAARRMDLLKQFSSYTGWNLIGGISHLFKAQGIAMLLNTFKGVVINAAFGIASQVNSQLQFFSSTIVTATRPQIVKSEGMGNRCRMLRVSVTTCKLTFVMLAVFVAPFIVECNYILEIWLKEVPKYTTQFVQLFLIGSLLRQLYTGVSIGIESVGPIKYLQIFVGGLHFFVLPVGYLMLYLDFGVLSVFYMLVIEELFCLILTTIISKYVTGLDVYMFVFQCVVPCVITFLVSYVVCSLLTFAVDPNFYKLLTVCIVSLIVTTFMTYFYVFDEKERSIVKKYLTSMILKIKKIRRK